MGLLEYALDLDEEVEDEEVDVAGWGGGREVALDTGVGDGDIIRLNAARGEVGVETLVSRGESGEERRGDEESGEGTLGV